MYHDHAAARGHQNMAMSQSDLGKTASALGIAVGSSRGELENTLDQTACALDELNSAIMDLEQRLQQVMKPDVPQPVGATTGAGAPTTVCGPAVAYLRNLRERVDSMKSRVHQIGLRLDT